MKSIILAGGFGTRLGNRTNLIPKPMVTIGGKPILWHIMKIYSHYGIHDFVICLGYLGDVIKEYFLHYEAYNNDFSISLADSDLTYHNKHDEDTWNVTLVDTGLNTLKGGRVKRIEQYLDDDIHLLTYGDGVADININELIDFHKAHGKTVTISGVHPPSRFGEIIEEDNTVKSFTEKPQTSQGLINGGFMVFNRELLDHLAPDEDCDLEIGALEGLAEKGDVMVFKHEGNWECMDTERDVNHLNNLYNTNNAFWKVW